MKIHKDDTALVVIDPQNDVLSEKGISWPLVGASVKENNTIENLGRLFTAAKEQQFGVFIFPHYLYPTDQAWRFGGPLEKGMLKDKEFWRPGPLDLRGFPGSGADWLEPFKPFIQDGKTVVVSPHKVAGPQSNDLVLQLRKRGINKVILAGMLANFCVESHLRELIEQGFEVAVVKDATAAPGVWRWLQGGAHQFRLLGERRSDDGRRREGHEVDNHEQPTENSYRDRSLPGDRRGNRESVCRTGFNAHFSRW